MTHTLMALYNEPEDPEAFDTYYAETHSQLALALPGLRAFSGTHPRRDGAMTPYYYVAVLTFDDEDALTAALTGPEGSATVDDLANFAGAGVTLLSGPSNVYR